MPNRKLKLKSVPVQKFEILLYLIYKLNKLLQNLNHNIYFNDIII